MRIKRDSFLLLFAALVSMSTPVFAEDAPTYRPSPGSQPPVYQPGTAPPPAPTGTVVMTPAAQAACSSLKDMISVVRRGRMTPGGELLPVSGVVPFKSPGAASCSAQAGSEAGSARASCIYAASGKSDAELKRTRLIAHTRDCLQGWPNDRAETNFMFQSPDRRVSGGVPVLENAGKYAVERVVYYDAVLNPVVKDDNCRTLEAMSTTVAGGFPATTVHRLPSGRQELNAPIGLANMCYAYPRTATGRGAGLTCTWIIDDKDPDGPGKEVLARGFYRRMAALPPTCRADQVEQPFTGLGNGELGNSITSGGHETWSVNLLGPAKGAPWSVMVTMRTK